MSGSRLRLERIVRTATVIDPVFLESPLVAFGPLNDAIGCDLSLKVETLNPIRCFKGRSPDARLA